MTLATYPSTSIPVRPGTTCAALAGLSETLRVPSAAGAVKVRFNVNSGVGPAGSPFRRISGRIP